MEGRDTIRERVRAWKGRLPQHIQRRIIFVAVAVAFVVLVFYVGVLRAPAEFPVRSVISIEEGTSLAQVANRLEAENIIRSAFWFRIFMTVAAGDGGVRAGDYYFDARVNLVSVAVRLGDGVYGLHPIRVTIPEGVAVAEMADILEKRIPQFDTAEFIALGQPLEGFLFPDTYFFPPNVTPKRVVRTMQDTFFRRVRDLEEEIRASEHSLTEIVIMASLLEKEARELETKRMIAGILWARLEIDMPLQVDASFRYINGKGTFDLTREDLANESPYNTYVHKGLPPGAITNPGIESIKAAATPIESDFLYYLADNGGTTHYSETFEEHKRKKALYLN